MLQIVLLILGGYLLVGGTLALAGVDKKTHKGVAVAMLVVGVALIVAGILLPQLLWVPQIKF